MNLQDVSDTKVPEDRIFLYSLDYLQIFGRRYCALRYLRSCKYLENDIVLISQDCL